MPPASRLALFAALVVAALPACEERGASASGGPLSGSKWEGTMTYRGVDDVFKLDLDEVRRDGALSGEIVWD